MLDTDRSIFPRPTAWVPVAMSAVPLGLMLVAMATGQARRQQDEGALARF
jgi:hypothetical protein